MEKGKKLWYVVNAYSGHEQKVKDYLESRRESMGMENNIFRVIIPERTEVEIKDGVKKEKVRKMFPGYVLIEMVMSDEAWYVVRNTPGVTGFIGSSGKGAKPIPLEPAEVDRILSTMGLSRIDVTKELETGKMVKILDGPFKNMTGKIIDVDMKTQKLNVSVDLFGQETTVEVDLSDIESV